MEPVKGVGRLFTTSAVDPKDELEERFERCVHAVNELTKGLADKDAHEALMNVACKDARAYEEISLGLTYLVLIEPVSAAKCYRDLALITRDGFQFIINILNQIALDKYMKLTDVGRAQLIWLVREIVRAGGAAFERLLLSLMRNIAGGDVSQKNLWLADTMLDIFIEQRLWLDKNPFMVGAVVYTYLRIMEDHMNPNLHSLLRKEAAFISTLLRERFVDCMRIGRDLVRALQNVARLQEFESIWKDLLWNPKALSPNLTGIAQLLSARTSRNFLIYRVTPDMEKKIGFLTSSVRFGNHKRYQDWFQRQYLSTTESQTLRCDLIRFIVGVIHPPNEVLSSDVLQRWTVIDWLLRTCTVSVITANCKLALFYDWFFYDVEKDNIMNIEPAILLMVNSMRYHPQTTVSLLDFLCRIAPNFYPPLADMVRLGVQTSLRQILKKGVLPSLAPIVDNPKMDRELRNLAIDMFPEFLTSADGEVHRIEDLGGPMRSDFGSPTPGDVLTDVIDTNHGSAMADEPTFSDDDESGDESTIAPPVLLEVKEKPRASPVPKLSAAITPLPALNRTLVSVVDKLDISASLEALEGPFRSCIDKLREEEDDEIRCEIMEELVQLIVKDELDSEDRAALAECVAVILSPQMECKVYPEVPTPESLEESTSSAFHVLFRALCEMTDDSPNRESLLDFLASLHKVQPRVAYHLLYFLRASRSAEGRSSVYEAFCQARACPLMEALFTDMKVCQEDDVQLFCWLVPVLYTWFPLVTVGDSQLLRLVMGTVDSVQLMDLISLVLQGRLAVLPADSTLISLLETSLSWDTFEQMALWQLVAAHGVSLHSLLPLIPIVKYPEHSEAISSLLIMLRKERPTSELVGLLLQRPAQASDSLVPSLLAYWSRQYRGALSDAVVSQLNTSLAQSKPSVNSPAKRKRAGHSGKAKEPEPPPEPKGVDKSLETMLGHLDSMRQCVLGTNGCLVYNLGLSSANQKVQENFFSLDNLQNALAQVQSLCTDSQKNRFSDLFALADTDVEAPPGKRGRKTTKTKGRQVMKYDSDSSEASSEEEVIKQRPVKKRRKAAQVGSDSD